MTDYYHDFDNGLDTNVAPYSPTNALKHLPGTTEATGNAVYNTNAGDGVFLARGSAWNVVASRWIFAGGDEGADGNPVVFDAYDRNGETGQPQPIVESFIDFNSGDWTESATAGVWFAALPVGTSQCPRVFFDMIGQKSGATSIVTCTAVTPWWFDNTNDRLYVYTGSSVNNPSDLYTVRATASNGSIVGFTPLHIQRCSHLQFNNITFRGGGNRNVIVQNSLLLTDTGGMHFNNCTMDYSGHSGIELVTSVAQNFTNQNIIENCVIDKKWSSLENIGATISGDGVLIDGGINYNLVVRNNTITDWTHSGITITNFSRPATTAGSLILQNKITAPNVDYGRGVGCNGTAGAVVDTVIRRNLISNTTTRNQIEGLNTIFSGNIIDTVRLGTAVANSSQGISTAARTTAEVDGVIIANNLIIDCDDHALRLIDSVTVPIVSYSAYNNICIQLTGATDSEVFTYTQDNVAAGTLNIRNNKIYSEQSATVIDWDGVKYTVTAAEAALTEMSDNLSTVETLSAVNDYLISKTSDCVGAGGHVVEIVMQEGFNGEPISSFDVDIGPNQSTFGPFHPKNL